MEARPAILQEIVASTRAVLKEIRDVRTDIRDLRNEVRGEVKSIRDRRGSNLRLVFSALIAVALGLASLMAKGFHWI
jgi:hypothetical protein